MTDYDSPWKEALDVYFQPFLAFFFAEAHADIDWRRGYEPLDKELQQIVREGELGRRLVDKLVKVWLKDGQEQWILIHVEVQTAEEADFARRMYVYNYRLFDRYNREVVSLAVLGDENPRWRPERFGYTRWGFHAGIRFPIAKLLDYATQLEALEHDRNPFATVVLAHLKTLETREDQGERHSWKVRLIKGLYDRGWAANDVRQLFRLIDWMMDLPKALEATFWREIKRYEEEKHMPFITTPERIGREEGLSEGLSQGRLEGIEVCLKLKFGEEGLRLMPEIREIHDQEKLEAILQAIETVASPENLRRMWTH
jgi:hypothetical protein